MNADNSLGFNQSSLILSLGKQTACKNSCINKFIKEDKHVLDHVRGMNEKKRDVIYEVLSSQDFDQEVLSFF